MKLMLLAAIAALSLTVQGTVTAKKSSKPTAFKAPPPPPKPHTLSSYKAPMSDSMKRYIQAKRENERKINVNW